MECDILTASAFNIKRAEWFEEYQREKEIIRLLKLSNYAKLFNEDLKYSARHNLPILTLTNVNDYYDDFVKLIKEAGYQILPSLQPNVIKVQIPIKQNL